MKHNSLFRIIFALSLFLSIFFLPFYVTIIFAVLGVFYFDKFIEVLFIFLFWDLIFGTKEVRFLNFPFVSFLFSVFILFLLEYLKTKIRK